MTNYSAPPDICLILEGTYPHALGGISTWVHLLTKYAPDIRFSIARIGLPTSAPAFTPSANVQIIEYIQAPETFSPHELRRWATANASQVPQATIYHAVGAGLAGALALATCRQRGQPFVLSEHANYVDELSRGALTLESGQKVPDGAEARHQILKTFEALQTELYRRADLTTALFPAARQKQIKCGAASSKTRVIPNGIQIPSSQQSPKDTLKIAQVGRANHIKGTDLFIEAAAGLLAERDDVSMELVGPQDESPDFVEDCKARVGAHKLKWSCAPYDRVWDTNPDIVVLSSRSEAQPFTLLEAGARGIPVVATDVGDCRRLLNGDGRAWGLVVPPANVSALQSAVADLIDNEEKRSELGSNGRDYVSKHHSVESMTASFQEAYRSIANGGSSCV
ncbi:MAG: GT4 family glycosyltransferase PelF [Myxococcota bacterium]